MFYNQDNTSSPIKFTPGRDNSYSSNSDLGTRPAGDPKSKKDFKKVMQKSDRDEDDDDKRLSEVTEEDGTIAEEEGIGKKTPSLFDLTSGKLARTSNVPSKPLTSGMDNEPLPENPVQIDPAATARASVVQLTKEEAPHVAIGDDRPPSFANDKKDKYTTRFATEQPDLSYVNPMALNTNKPAEIGDIRSERPLPVANLQQIINQLVDRVTEMKDAGRTETTIVLKQPPLLAGANLMVTSYDNARGEFNIAFSNLTQAAKNLLDQQINQESLLLALEKKGYAVHILTTTTLENPPIIAEAQRAPREQSDGREDRGGQQEEREGQGRQPRQQG